MAGDHGKKVGAASAAALIGIFLLQGFSASRLKSPVYDEPPHIAAGLSYLQTGDFHANPQHPPLLKELSGLSLLLAGMRWPQNPAADRLRRGAAPGIEWAIGNEFIAANGPDRVLFWARLPMLLLSALLGWLIYCLGRRMFGQAAGLAALFLFALDPNIVAHGSFVTTDVGFAAFSFLFFYLLWSYLQKPDGRRLLWCGLAMGAMLSAKFSAVFLLPVAAILILAAVYWPADPALVFPLVVTGWFGRSTARAAGPYDPCPCGSGRKYRKCHGADDGALNTDLERMVRKRQSLLEAVCAFLAMTLVAAFVVQCTYFFSDPLLYVKGLRLVNADHHPAYLVFMAGRMESRFLSYFAVVYLLKEPLATLLLVGLGAAVVVRNRSISRLQKLFVILPPAVLFTAHSLWAANFGIRYLMPALPFAYLLGGAGLAALLRGGSVWGRVVAAALGVWLAVTALGIYPDHLAYFNEAACLAGHPNLLGMDGGSRCGVWWLDDSNVDWGQGLRQLNAWADQHAKGRRINLAYFGSFPPENYIGPYQKIGFQELIQPPKPGVYVVSAHFRARAAGLSERYYPDANEWLWHTAPTAVVGHSLYVYDVPEK